MTNPAPTPTAADAERVGPIPTLSDELPSTGDLPTPAEPSASVGLLAAACTSRVVRLYRERGNGTHRALPYLADGSPARMVADYLAASREAGAPVPAIAADTHLSRATVRRTLDALALTEEIEDGDHDDLYSEDLAALYFTGTDDEDGE